MFLRVVHGLDAGQNEIEIEGERIKTFTKKLAALEAQPEAFSFKFQGQDLHATLSADVKTQRMTLSVGGAPYY